MAFVPVLNTIECEIRMELHGQKIENTLYFKPVLPEGLGNTVALGNAILVWWASTLAPNLSEDLILRELYMTDLTTAESGTLTVPAPAPAPVGGRTSDSLPGNCALCVSFRTGMRGRSRRGRNYVPGLAELDVADSRVDATRADAIVAAYEALATAIAAEDWTHVVVSRFSGVDAQGNPIPRAAGVTTEVTAYVIVDTVVDSQRRRLPSRGQ